jgi:hypothetical protein
MRRILKQRTEWNTKFHINELLTFQYIPIHHTNTEPEYWTFWANFVITSQREGVKHIQMNRVRYTLWLRQERCLKYKRFLWLFTFLFITLAHSRLVIRHGQYTKRNKPKFIKTEKFRNRFYIYILQRVICQFASVYSSLFSQNKKTYNLNLLWAT